MVLVVEEDQDGILVNLPNGFTPLLKLHHSEHIDKKYQSMESKYNREYMVTCFGGVVRKASYNQVHTRKRLSIFLNCQDSTNNTTGELDFPISLMAADFPIDLHDIKVDEGDTFIGMNFGILVGLFHVFLYTP